MNELDNISLDAGNGTVSLVVDEFPVSSAVDKAEGFIVLTTVGVIAVLACIVIAIRSILKKKRAKNEIKND